MAQTRRIFWLNVVVGTHAMLMLMSLMVFFMPCICFSVKFFPLQFSNAARQGSPMGDGFG